MESDVDELDPAPADAIEHFPALHVTQTGMNRYTVADLEEQMAYQVSVSGDGVTCECGECFAADDGEEPTACSHALYAIYKAPSTVSADVVALRQVGNLHGDVVNALSRVEAALAGGSAGGSTSSSGGAADEEEAEEPEPIDADEAAEELLTKFDGWLPQAVKFDPDADEEAFDIEIVNLEWAEWEGEEGIWIDMAPFGTSYWDGDDWADKEGYDAAREALVETLKKRDEVQYSGPPSFVNFVERSDVEEVVG